MPFGVALAADSTGLRQIVEHLRQTQVQLQFQAPRLLRRSLLALARAPALALRLGRRLGLGLRRRLLAHLDRRGVARHVTNQMILHRVLDQSLVQPAR